MENGGGIAVGPPPERNLGSTTPKSAVAQLRMYAELIELIGKPPRAALVTRMYWQSQLRLV
jgi:hypothetical protein